MDTTKDCGIYRARSSKEILEGLKTVGAALVCSIVLMGCTVLPVKEFSNYREAVGKAREAGETVLTDYSAALAEQSALQATRKSGQPMRPGAIDPLTLATGSATLDYVAVRYQAWAVVGKYNEALVSLAEGRSASGVAAAVDGLVNSLSQSPFSQATELASAAAPFLGPLKVLLEEADKEMSRQRFLAGLKTGLPLINEKLIPLLSKDVQLMAEVRFGLNDLQYQRALDRVNDARRPFDTLRNNYAPNDNIRRMNERVSEALAKLPRDSDSKPAAVPSLIPRAPAQPGTAPGEITAAVVTFKEPATPTVLAQLELQQVRILAETANALRTTKTLLPTSAC